MSWDLVVFDFENPLSDPDNGLATFPDGWEPPVIGPAAEVRAAIDRALPGIDWADPVWGQLDGDGFSMEFNMGDEDPVTNFMIHARGRATAAAVTLMSATGWRLLDTGTGKWLHTMANPDEGRAAFQAFRDKVLEPSTQTTRPGLLARIFKMLG